jgi:PIN domain nuclease of toxin-antitoxin system
MGAVVADTHTALWYLLGSEEISSLAIVALDEAVRAGDPVYIASISLVEITYLVEKGRLPEVAFDQLIEALADPDSGFVIAPLDLAVVDAIRKIPRKETPDMPDRIIAGTALHLNLPLVTRDQRIRAAGIRTIW